MQATKPDRGSHVTMTFSKATRLFSRWSNSGKSSSSSCDSRAVSSATARKSSTCEANVHVREKVKKHYRTIHGVLGDVVEQMVIEFEVRPESEDSSSCETESSKDEE